MSAIAAGFRHLVSSDDKQADSLIIGAMAALFMLFFLQAWDTIIAGREFPTWTFAAASGTLLAALGGSKTLRDKIGMSNQPTPQAIVATIADPSTPGDA